MKAVKVIGNLKAIRDIRVIGAIRVVGAKICKSIVLMIILLSL